MCSTCGLIPILPDVIYVITYLSSVLSHLTMLLLHCKSADCMTLAHTTTSLGIRCNWPLAINGKERTLC